MLFQATEVFLLKENHILLGHKKTGMGTGKILGIGGHVEAGERLTETAVREVKEEVFITLKEAALQPIAIFEYIYPAKPKWNAQVHFFTVRQWEGTPQESSEIKPEFFPLNNIPYDQMWQDSKLWLADALKGKRLKGKVTFGNDNETVVEHSIVEWI
ncbi:MAG: 8-oxo-dGTP diphosphatase [Chloroflexota bacterium]